MARVIDQLIKDVLEFEWTRLEHLSAATMFQSGLALAFAGGVAYVSKNSANESPTLLLETCWWLVILGLGGQVVCLIRAWHGYKYWYLPQPLVLRKQFVELCKAYSGHFPPEEALPKLR